MTCLALAGKCEGLTPSGFGNVPARPTVPNPAPIIFKASRLVIEVLPFVSVYEHEVIRAKQSLCILFPCATVPEESQPQLNFSVGRGAGIKQEIGFSYAFRVGFAFQTPRKPLRFLVYQFA